MLLYLFAALCLCLWQVCVAHAIEDRQEQQDSIWRHIDNGLSMATFELSTTPRVQNDSPQDSNVSSRPALVVLRIAPNLWEFSVHCATLNDKKSLSLRDWAEQENLTAAINASMYLPDGLTSTGYLQSGDHINNSRMGSRLGAFFVAEPHSSKTAHLSQNSSSGHKILPLAALLDKYADSYQELIPHYGMVVQNFRLISPDRHILWNAGGARHSITAVGQDAQGNILFLHCAKPMTPHEFASVLLALPLDIRNTMYVEGGSESAMLLRSPEATQVWIGKLRPEILGFGNSNIPLPNIIGVRPRQ